MSSSDRLGGVLVWASLVSMASVATAQIELPGTQPGDLTEDIRSPVLCRGCHGDYADYSPWDTWAGTMMANATRDPLFHAALTIANQDVPGSGDLCIRCHSPRGWLMGRSEPTDGSALEGDDFEGVSCDFCHRIDPGPDGELLLGNGQYFVGDDVVRRGPLGSDFAPHETQRADHFVQSAFCGQCHDVSNPLEDGFAIERTFTEWFFSDFSVEGRTCQSCHMPAQQGIACGAPGAPQRQVNRHQLAGGNTWMPRVLAAEYPELGRGEAYERTAQAAEAMLESAATVTLDGPRVAIAGQTIDLTVRVENHAGHKLPTGYPEGRRCWLQIEVFDDAGEVLFESGAYDEELADRVADDQLRTYEVIMAADGEEGFHFILQDELLQDNRIPPRGFTPTEDTAPVGREYATLADGTLAHWDEAPYTVALPAGTTGLVTIEARLLYQTTSRPYIEFLRDDNRSDDNGERLYAIWDAYDRAPPYEMASADWVLYVETPAIDDEPEVIADSGNDAPQADVGSSGEGCTAAGTKPARGGGTSIGFAILSTLVLATRKPRRTT